MYVYTQSYDQPAGFCLWGFCWLELLQGGPVLVCYCLMTFGAHFSLLSRFAWGSSCAPFELWDAIRKQDGQRFVVKLLRTHAVKKEEIEKILDEAQRKYPASIIVASECYQDEEQCLYLLYEQPKHTMLSLSRFHVRSALTAPSISKGMGARDSRLRFITFQFMKSLCCLHSHSLLCDELHPANVCLDHTLWLQLFINLQSSRSKRAMQRRQEQEWQRWQRRRKQQYTPVYRDPNHDKPITCRIWKYF